MHARILLTLMTVAGMLLLSACGAGRSPVEASGAGRPSGRTPVTLAEMGILGDTVAAGFPRTAVRQVLLGFEGPDDLLFVRTGGRQPARADNRNAFGGSSSLAVDDTARTVSINLDSLVRGRSFPGRWTLAEMRVWTDTPTTARLVFSVDGAVISDRSVPLTPGSWTALATELFSPTAGAQPPQGAPGLQLVIDPPARGLRVDDVALVEDGELWTAGHSDDVSHGVSQRESRGAPQGVSPDVHTAFGSAGSGAAGVGGDLIAFVRGQRVFAGVPGRFLLVLPGPDLPGGWTRREAGPMRVILERSGSVMVIYRDGRVYENGGVRSAVARDGNALATGHAQPATVDIQEDQGRVERLTPGDANHDGYNELTGSYRLTVTAGRATVVLRPAGSAMARPVLEIAGLPEGEAVVTVEGQLVTDTARLPSGALLATLPVRVDRATVVSVAVR